MTELLVTTGILSPVILEKMETSMTVYLYDSNLLTVTLKSAYEVAKSNPALPYLTWILLRRMGCFNKRNEDAKEIIKALRRSKDFTNFLDLIPINIFLFLEREKYLEPIVTALNKGVVTGCATEEFARLLSLNPKLHGTASFPFPVGKDGEKMIDVSSGRTPGNFPVVAGISHVILGYPLLPKEDLKKISQKLLDAVPRVGKTDEEREAYAQEHRPIIITAEDVLTAGGMVRLYL